MFWCIFSIEITQVALQHPMVAIVLCTIICSFFMLKSFVQNNVNKFLEFLLRLLCKKGASHRPNTICAIASQLANTHTCVGCSPRRGFLHNNHIIICSKNPFQFNGGNYEHIIYMLWYRGSFVLPCQ